MKATRGVLAALFLGSTLGAGAVFAKPPPPPGAPARSVQPAVQNGDRGAERWDLKRLQGYEDRFALARKRNNRGALRQVETDLQQYIASELRESNSEVREARSDGRPGTRSEVREESKERHRIRAIDQELERLYGRYDRSSMKKKAALIQELVKLAKADVADARKDDRKGRRL